MIRPPRTSPFFPSTTCFLFCDVPRFEAHQPAPPSSSPPVRECSFVTCHVSRLTKPPPPLHPTQRSNARLCRATIRSPPTPRLHLPPPHHLSPPFARPPINRSQCHP